MKKSNYNKQVIISYVQSEIKSAYSFIGAQSKGLERGISTDLISMEKFKTEDISKIKEAEKNLNPNQGIYLTEKNSPKVLAMWREDDPVYFRIHKQEFSNKDDADKFFNLKRDEKLNSIDHDSRIYVAGHGDRGSSSLQCGNGKYVNYKEVADLIAKIPSINQEVKKPVTVSLILCNGGQDGLLGFGRSFGEKLSLALADRGVHARVAARTGIVGTNYSTKSYRKTVDVLHHGIKHKMYFETLPGTKNTLKRYAIYGDNLGSLLYAKNESNNTADYAKKLEVKLKANPGNKSIQKHLIEAKSTLASTLNDLMILSGRYKDMGDVFNEANTMRWGKDGTLTIDEMSKLIEDLTISQVKEYLANDPSIIKDKIQDFKNIMNTAEKSGADTIRIEKSWKEMDNFKSGMKNEISQVTKYLDSETVSNCKKLAKTKKDQYEYGCKWGGLLLERYKAVIAVSCLKLGIESDNLKEYKGSLASKAIEPEKNQSLVGKMERTFGI